MSDIGKSLVTELDVIKNRKANPQEGSYTSYLFSKGVDKILKKVGEEATEVIIAAKDNNNTETVAGMMMPRTPLAMCLPLRML